MSLIHLTEYACDYCGGSQRDVSFLIIGPKDSAICEKCVDICREEIDKRKAEAMEAANVPER